MKLFRKMLCVGLLGFSSTMLLAEEVGVKAMQEASAESKSLFIFFYKDQGEKTLRLQKIFDETTKKLGGQIRSVKIKANDPKEKTIVSQFDLKRTPMPFVLVLAPNGAVTGGFPSFTEEQLVNSISSPGAASCLKALQNQKLVLLCLQNNRTANNEAALQGVRAFRQDPRFSQAAEIVMIDPSDMEEQKFLSQLSLNTNSPEATTVLIAPPAEVVGTYQGSTSKDQFVSDLQKASSGCSPGGCCPGGKCSP